MKDTGSLEIKPEKSGDIVNSAEQSDSEDKKVL
jgi:hypothetical protein